MRASRRLSATSCNILSTLSSAHGLPHKVIAKRMASSTTPERSEVGPSSA